MSDSPSNYSYERPGPYLASLDAKKRRQGFVAGVVVTVVVVALLGAAVILIAGLRAVILAG